MKKVLTFNIIVFLVILLISIFLEHFTDIEFNKKKKFIVCTLFLVSIFILNYFFTISMNPKISAKLLEDSLFLNEEIKYSDIESAKCFSNCSLKIVPNGFRWSYKDYYSGDANVEISDNENEVIDSYYRAKIYYKLDVNNIILVKDKTTDKIYIFNLDTDKKTLNFYKKLFKHINR